MLKSAHEQWEHTPQKTGAQLDQHRDLQEIEPKLDPFLLTTKHWALDWDRPW